jgi:hypothetical protein
MILQNHSDGWYMGHIPYKIQICAQSLLLNWTKFQKKLGSHLCGTDSIGSHNSSSSI